MAAAQRPVRLSDVAEAAGVSLATASRALNGQNGVSPALAQTVRGVARSLGYVANLHARRLAGGATSVIGLIVHEIDDPYFTEIAAGVIRSALAENLMVQVSHSGRDPEQELQQVTALVVQGVDAIIIAGSGYTDPDQEARAKDVLAAYEQRGGRAAVIGRHHLGVDAVLPDNAAAGAAAARHLVELGHRDVLVAGGSPELTTVVDRLDGVRSVFEPAGVRSTVSHDGFSDVVAIGVLQQLRRLGLTVPQDISVVGIDDIAVAQSLAPALTTVALPLHEMGRTAFTMVRTPPTGEPRRRLVPSRLVVRESTAEV